jgi:hypothetical protein
MDSDEHAIMMSKRKVTVILLLLQEMGISSARVE